MKIGEFLTKSGLISTKQLKEILQEHEETNVRIGDIVINKGFVTAEELAPVLAKYFDIPFIKLKEIYKEISEDVISVVPEELAYKFTVIPINLTDKTLTIAMFDPLDLTAIDSIRIATGYKISYTVAIHQEIIEALEYCYHSKTGMKEHIHKFVERESEFEDDEQDEIDDLNSRANDAPVVKYVKSLIVQAFNNHVSDIILQPKEDHTELRMRIDGVLHQSETPPIKMLSAITARIKILSGLDIAEKRLPQDGRFKMVFGKREVDLRVSVFPTIYGESIVIRLLDPSSTVFGLDELGMDGKSRETFLSLIKNPYGFILVTGPTGSGKTTTLYTALNEIKDVEKNIVTMEDPVEYRLPFLQQSQINAQIDFTFARGLRSLLRQDPDIMMVGEIRDRETAEIVIHSALTGHLVFSTLHTNDSASAAIRLINMGVEPYLITSSLLGVVAQRLMRKICENCKIEEKLDPKLGETLFGSEKPKTVCRGEGCDQCLRRGYKGREGIYEILTFNDEVRDLVLKQESAEKIKVVAQAAGMKTLREQALEKLKAGVTTVSEVLRIT